MLKGLHPLLTPELLYVLALMGHGDQLAIVDANFPAHNVARETPHGQAVCVVGATMPEVARVVLTVLPLDDAEASPVRVMAAPGPDLPPVHRELQDVLSLLSGGPCQVGKLDRFGFYEASRHSYAVVQTGEERLYGNTLLRKGVVAPAT